MKHQASTTRWAVALAQPQDRQAIRTLFEDVFKQPMSASLWHWKYGDGRGQAAIARRHGQVIAHFGGLYRDIQFQQQRHRAMQCVDVMVIPSERGTLTRNGPFCLTAKYFLNLFVGYDRPCRLGFGFPQARLLKMSQHLNVQTPVGNIVEPTWHAPSLWEWRRTARYIAHDLQLDKSDHQSIVEQLNHKMLEGLHSSIVGIRDLGYIKHRYFEHPLHTHTVQIVYRSGTPSVLLGIVVWRLDRQQILLLDTIGDPQFFPQLIDYVRTQIKPLGMRQMSMWISQTHLPLFGNQHAKLVDPQVQTPSITCTPGPSPEELYNKWFLTTGDTDFR